MRTSFPRTLLAAAESLTLYADVLADPIGRDLVEILRSLCHGGNGCARLHRRLLGRLAEESELYTADVVGDWLQNHLLDRILDDKNAFSLKCERVEWAGISRATQDLAAADLEALRALLQPLGQSLAAACSAHASTKTSRRSSARHAGRSRGAARDGGTPVPPLPAWPAAVAGRLSADFRAAMKQRLLNGASGDSPLRQLAAYYHTHGAGEFGRYRAFRWAGDGAEPRLEGIADPDPIALDGLFAYDAERALLIENTEQFAAGFRANNVLVYGDRGTGKSSTIKALLSRYADRRLRLVELPQSRLRDFPRLLRLLRGRSERFVLFVDDLSFEEYETDYKELKALLEGGLEARPDNVVLYATSNRRHLVTERFSDRRHVEIDEEIHPRDTAEEKLSLSDRFGITLTFTAPDQPRYLEIVRGLAAAGGLAMADGELCERALLWAQQRNGRSGRTARQFVDFLTAELAIGSSLMRE